MAHWVFVHTTYYFLLASTLLWGWFVWRLAARVSLAAWIRKNRLGLAAALVLTILTFWAVPPELRILSDESNLVGVSRSFAFEKRFLNPTMGLWYFDSYWPIQTELEKRPALFAFLVSLLHSTSGYRVANAYALNALALAVLLIGVFRWMRRRNSEGLALAAMTLVLAQPIVALSASSAGFDFFALLLFLAAFAAGSAHLRQPKPETLALFHLQLLLLVYGRQESMVLAAVLFVGFTLAVRPTRKLFTPYAWLHGLIPVLTIPRLAQILLHPGSYENPPDVAAFSLGHLANHARELVQNWVRLDSELPYSTALNAFGLLALVLAISTWRKRNRVVRWEQGILFAALAVFLGIILSFHSGQYIQPAMQRYFLLPCILTSLGTAAGLAHYLPRRGDIALATALALLVVFFPTAIENRNQRSLLAGREFRASLDFLATQGAPRRIAILAERPGNFIAYEYGAVGLDFGRDNPDRVRDTLNRHLVDKFFAIQKVNYGDNLPLPGHELPPVYLLTPEYRMQIDPTSYLRISSVRIDNPVPTAPPQITKRAPTPRMVQ